MDMDKVSSGARFAEPKVSVRDRKLRPQQKREDLLTLVMKFGSDVI
jgi:hypothetical protein